MNDDAKKLELMREMLSDFMAVVRDRPLMYGTVLEVNAMMHLYDGMNFIVRHGEKMDWPQFSWMTFLGELGYLKGARNVFLEEVAKDPMDFALFCKLRGDYEKWVELKRAARAV